MNDFHAQFKWEREYWLKGADFPTWYRYYILIKEVLLYNPKSILEIGTGSGIIKNILKDNVNDYTTMDINTNLNPDVTGDLRKTCSSLKDKFECVICLDVLEHMPFKDLKLNLTNIFSYLSQGGVTLISIPHRRKEVMIISRFSGYKIRFISLPLWVSLRGFYTWHIKKRVSIDPNHCWEIGDKKVKKRDVEDVIKTVGFEISKFMKLPYVDFWILKKIRW